jgi:hypothetical protein
MSNSLTQNMDAVCSYETLVNLYRTTRRYVTEDNRLLFM